MPRAKKKSYQTAAMKFVNALLKQKKTRKTGSARLNFYFFKKIGQEVGDAFGARQLRLRRRARAREHESRTGQHFLGPAATPGPTLLSANTTWCRLCVMFHRGGPTEKKSFTGERDDGQT